jgi:hypothetical protein
MLQPEAVEAILHIVGAERVTRLDDVLHSVDSPQLSAMARILPPDAISQIVRTADRTSTYCSDVTAAVAISVAERARAPKDAAHGEPHDRRAGSRVTPSPIAVAGPGFPADSMPTAGPRTAGSPVPWRQRRPSTWARQIPS